MHHIRIQRLIFPESDRNTALYYRSRPGTRHARDVRTHSRRSAVLRAACTFSTDTYFNAVFATHWCALGDLDEFRLNIRLSGAGVLRVFRAALGEAEFVLHEAPFAGENTDLEARVAVAEARLDKPALLYFEIAAGDADVFIVFADWFARSRVLNEVRLAGGYCTYQRDQYLLRNIDRLSGDPDVYQAMHRFIIVDNGRSENLRAHLARVPSKFSLYQQDNVGGAGGFARVILEARSDETTTHILLMDDDAVIEPESILRLRAAFELACRPVSIGGHMLDALRGNVLFEAGARYVPEKLRISPMWQWLDLEEWPSLLLLSKPYAIDYNGWWFFGFPAPAVTAGGMPMPFFIRTDDIEFGHRLRKQGIATSAIPGIAVWHEPFYAKVGGWQQYFQTRNLLISAAIHQDRWGKRAARANFRRIVACLLSLDYYEAWLHIRAAQDFLAGPQVLEQPPAAKLKALEDARRSLVADLGFDKSRRLRPLPMRSRFLYARRLRRLERRWQILRHWLLPARRLRDPEQLEGAVQARDLAWWNVASRDVFAIDHHLSFTYEVRHRDRPTFRRLYAEARRATTGIMRDEARLTNVWRGAFQRFVGPQWWTSYLGLDSPAAAPGRSPAGAKETVADASLSTGKEKQGEARA